MTPHEIAQAHIRAMTLSREARDLIRRGDTSEGRRLLAESNRLGAEATAAYDRLQWGRAA